MVPAAMMLARIIIPRRNLCCGFTFSHPQSGSTLAYYSLYELTNQVIRLSMRLTLC